MTFCRLLSTSGTMEPITQMPAMLIAMASWVTLTYTEIYTSSFQVHSMVLEEERALDALKSYIDSQHERLAVLSNEEEFAQYVDHTLSPASICIQWQDMSGQLETNTGSVHKLELPNMHTMRQTFYTDRLREVKLRQNSDLDLKHPNAVYNVIKQYASVYSPVMEENVENFTAFLEKSGDVFLANAGDVKGAKESMLRLQKVYKMKAAHMVKGDYLGHKGPELQPVDAYQIGVVALSNGLLDEAADWLQTSLAMNTESTMNDTPSTTSELSVAAVQALLGRVYVRKGETDLAKQFLVQAKTIEKGSTRIGDIVSLEKELNRTWSKHTPQADDAVTANFSRLCRLENKIYPAEPNSPLSICRYRAALLPYNVFQEEILSVSPFSSVIYNVVSDLEVEHMKDRVRGKLKRGMVRGLSVIISSNRTTKIAWINDRDSPVAASVSRRIECITGLDTTQRLPNGPSSAEPFQVANYGLGGHYGVHFDMFDNPTETSDLVTAGNRLATFLIYLSDVERGGATVFPSTGVVVAPVKNMALFWYNFDTALQKDKLTRHAGCPVLIGQKWIANKWIWTYGNTFRRRCGLTPNATQLEIEADMTRCYRPA